MAKVTAITLINHDGVLYNPGDTFECTAAQAKTLCGLGSAKMAGRASAEDAETGGETETTAPPKPVTPKAVKGKAATKGK